MNNKFLNSTNAVIGFLAFPLKGDSVILIEQFLLLWFDFSDVKGTNLDFRNGILQWKEQLQKWQTWAFLIQYLR